VTKLTTYCERIIAWLDEHPGTHTYTEVAEGLGSNAGRGVGSAMRPICTHGLHQYCRRVVSKRTGKHNCSG